MSMARTENLGRLMQQYPPVAHFDDQTIIDLANLDSLTPGGSTLFVIAAQVENVEQSLIRLRELGVEWDAIDYALQDLRDAVWEAYP